MLIDTPPDIREQLLDAQVATIDGVLFTHDHADHTHGIDDLRMLAYNAKRRVDVHFDAVTRASLITRFGYCFEAPPGSMYAPILNAHLIAPPTPVRINGGSGPIDAIPVVQAHGDAESLGFRFGDIAYSPDISGLSPTSRKTAFAASTCGWWTRCATCRIRATSPSRKRSNGSRS